MRRTPIAAAVVSLVVLAACDTSGEPSAPPTAQDALTTATSSPPEDEVVTSEPATEEPTTEEPEAGGPPQMPAEAMEQTEAGAEAFVEHYLELLNYTGIAPNVALLQPLSTDACATCQNYETNVEELAASSTRNSGRALEISQVDAVSLGPDGTVVFADIQQNEYSVISDDGEVVTEYELIPDAQLKFQLQSAEPWEILEIQVAAEP